MSRVSKESEHSEYGKERPKSQQHSSSVREMSPCLVRRESTVSRVSRVSEKSENKNRS